MVLLLSLVLAAAPLSVRVLEREQPASVSLEARTLSCDGARLPDTRLEFVASGRKVQAGARACEVVSATGPLSVKVGELERRYTGALTVVNERERLKLVLQVDVEAYLPSVVASEAKGLGPEALAAQAVVSRTFALASRRRHGLAGYDVCDLAHCQVFRGDDEADAPSRAAVQRTQGQVLLVGGVRLAPAYFHAACGGGTASSADVFQENAAGASVDDVEQGKARCAAAPGFEWSFHTSRAELARALGVGPTGEAFEPLRRDTHGRVLQVRSFGKRLTGNEFQAKVGRVFGWSAVKSMVVKASELDDEVTLTGHGIGHGVGLCQHGAAALAARGVAFQDILKRYFPDCVLRPAP